jgi:DNA-binding HxlR family transcriptional regulator
MPSRSSCKIDDVLDVVSDPWTLAIVHELTVGPRRTSELYEAFDGMSTKTLVARLKKLQRRGLVVRKTFTESPPRVEYSLTEKGARLNMVLDAITEIAEEWNSPLKDDREPCQACEMRHTQEQESLADQEEINITDLSPPENERDSDLRPPRLNDVTLL